VIQQTWFNDFITNVYHVNELTIADAVGVGHQVALQHQKAITAWSRINAMRVSSPAPDDGVFATIPLNLVGTRPGTGEAMPPFNRIMVSFQVAYTYKCRKFITAMVEGDSSSGEVVASVLTDLQTNYINPLLALGSLCNPDGVLFTGGAAEKSVAMRQLRRKKKRVTPVI
jgi:hypothetical protein